MSKVIRIGTRASELALWQAHHVQGRLQAAGHKTEIVEITSEGDQTLDVPLYEMGITGIFTRSLDIALLQDRIDIAVHSLKDVPTALPKNTEQYAVLERAEPWDILVYKPGKRNETPNPIATGSLRRKSWWLHQHAGASVVDLRGNVNTRLKKLQTGKAQAAVFAMAGLDRIDILPQLEKKFGLKYKKLKDLVPAPAQGAIMVMGRSDDAFSKEACTLLNHEATAHCVHVERQFLRTLEGGCTAPIGGYATIDGDFLKFKGSICSLDGTKYLELERSVPTNEYKTAGETFAKALLASGGEHLMSELRKSL